MAQKKLIQKIRIQNKKRKERRDGQYYRMQIRISIENGENIEDIAADYPALTTDDLEAIKEALNTN